MSIMPKCYSMCFRHIISKSPEWISPIMISILQMETLILGNFTKLHTWKVPELQFQFNLSEGSIALTVKTLLGFPLRGIHPSFLEMQSTCAYSHRYPLIIFYCLYQFLLFPTFQKKHWYYQGSTAMPSLSSSFIFIFFLLLPSPSPLLLPFPPPPLLPPPPPSSLSFCEHIYFPLINLIQLPCRSHWRNEKLVFKLLCIQQGNEHLESPVVEAKRRGRPADSSTPWILFHIY